MKNMNSLLAFVKQTEERAVNTSPKLGERFSANTRMLRVYTCLPYRRRALSGGGRTRSIVALSDCHELSPDIHPVA